LSVNRLVDRGRDVRRALSDSLGKFAPVGATASADARRAEGALSQEKQKMHPFE
jgi:hypothetical protein